MSVSRWISVAAVLVSGVCLADGTRLAARSAGGTVIGVITTKEGARPSLRVTLDPGVCGASVPDESVVVDAAGHLANTVVTVTGLKAAAPAETTVTNEKCRFVPHVATLKPA